MKYRSHRGSLIDSLDTQVEVDGIKSLLDHINKDRGKYLPKVEDIQIKFYAHDERIPSDVYLVCEVVDGKPAAIGMIDEPTD